MNERAVRLIADRGHGLSPQQRYVLRGVGRGDIRCNPNGVDGSSWWAETYRPVKTQTIRSLEERGLVCRPPRGVGTEAAWGLTADGETVLARMGGVR